MVEIKSGVLKDAKGQYKGMVIFQKGKKIKTYLGINPN